MGPGFDTGHLAQEFSYPVPVCTRLSPSANWTYFSLKKRCWLSVVTVSQSHETFLPCFLISWTFFETKLSTVSESQH